MSGPLRIAMFVGSFPAVSETFVVRQITGLIDLGHDVDIFSDTRGDDELMHPEITKYRLLERTTWLDMPPEVAPFEMPVWPITGRTWPPGSEKSIHNSVRTARAVPRLFRCLVTAPRLATKVLRSTEYGYQASSLSALYRLAKLCTIRKKYDVLHAHFGPVGNSFRFTKGLWNAPLIVSFHGYDLCTVPREEGNGVYRKLFATADAVTAHSEYASRRLEALGCPHAMLHRLRVGVNLDDFEFRERKLKPHEPVRILTVARLVEIKGLEYSIQAVALLCKDFPAIRYDIIGDGPCRDALEKMIRQLGLEKNVTLHGARAGDFVQELMARTHLFVLPSVNLKGDEEGTPVTLMEAQACGIPAVATRTGGIPEVVIDGESGFLVADRNTEALAERLRFLVQHSEIWPEMGRKGRSHVERHYDIRELNRQLVGLYEEIVDAYRAKEQTAAK